MRMSIWNLPVFGWEKWFLAVEMMCGGPWGLPMSAWTVMARMLCSSWREVAKVVARVVEESEV